MIEFRRLLDLLRMAEPPVTNIRVCYQADYHKMPFVHGSRNGKDVWLLDDGTWTEQEDHPRIGTPFYQNQDNLA